MFCSNCGTKNDDTAKFCISCGSELAIHIDQSDARPTTKSRAESNQRRLIAILIGIGILAAMIICVGVGFVLFGRTGGDEPVAVVKKMMRAAQHKDFDEMANYFCAARREELVSALNFDVLMADSFGTDVDAQKFGQKLLDAYAVELSDIVYEEIRKTDDRATVHVKGRIELKIDRKKWRDAVRDLAKSQGVTDLTDSEIDEAAEPEIEWIEKNHSEDIDEDIRLVKEDSKWLVCTFDE